MLELQKALAMDERLAVLLKEAAKNYADLTLRQLYGTVEPAFLLRQTGMAEGVEQFIKGITKPPVPTKPTKPAQPDRS